MWPWSSESGPTVTCWSVCLFVCGQGEMRWWLMAGRLLTKQMCHLSLLYFAHCVSRPCCISALLCTKRLQAGKNRHTHSQDKQSREITHNATSSLGEFTLLKSQPFLLPTIIEEPPLTFPFPVKCICAICLKSGSDCALDPTISWTSTPSQDTYVCPKATLRFKAVSWCHHIHGHIYIVTLGWLLLAKH